MALTYAQAFNAMQGGAAAEVQRITAAAVRAALDISGESAQTPNHTNRVALAKAVLNAPLSFGPLFALGVAVDSTAGAGMTDAQYLAIVKQNWDAFAGVA